MAKPPLTTNDHELRIRQKPGREDQLILDLLRCAVPLLELERKLQPEDFERWSSLREFIQTGHRLIRDLGYGDA